MTIPDGSQRRPSSATLSDPRYSGVSSPIHVRVAGVSAPPPTPCPVPNVLDDFDDRTLPNTTPSFISGNVTGKLGLMSCGVDGAFWDDPVGTGFSRQYVGVSSGFARLRFDGSDPAFSPEHTEFDVKSDSTNADHSVRSPTNEEPIASFRFRTSMVPDGAAGSVDGTRDYIRIEATWGAIDSSESLEMSILISSVDGIGKFGPGFGGVGFGFPDGYLAKTDWVAGAWYTAYMQYLHDGTIRVKLVKDGEADPGWQVSSDPGYPDYVSWGGGGFFDMLINVQDDLCNDPSGLGGGDVIDLDLDTITVGTVIGVC